MPDTKVSISLLEGKLKRVAELIGCVTLELRHTPYSGYGIERTVKMGNTKRGPYKCVSAVSRKEAWEWLDGYAEAWIDFTDKLKAELKEKLDG